MRRIILVVAGIAAGLLACSAASKKLSAPRGEAILQPVARVETVPVPNSGDAADDPAVWVDPQDPSASLVLGTDKRGALHTYNMDGSHHQSIAEGLRPNNVDVLYGFRLGGQTVDLAVAGVQAGASGLKVWAIDVPTRNLRDVTDAGVIGVLDGGTPNGVCGYRSGTGRFYAFVTGMGGRVEQIELQDAGAGTVRGTRVRAFEVSSIAEGCVADDALGDLYLAEENVGIWKFGAEPDDTTPGRLVARVGQNGLKADVEGLAIYQATGNRGYLIASSQGNDTFKLYERGGDNRYVATIDPRPGPIDDVSHTDGIAVTNCPTSPLFARGVFVVQDDSNGSAHQNFKLYAWEDIAGSRLLMDLQCPE